MNLENNFEENVNEYDLPISLVAKSMRKALDGELKTSRDSKYLIQECALEFLHFVTGEAQMNASADGRTTISPEHIFRCLEELGFDQYTEYLKLYLRKYHNVSVFNFGSFLIFRPGKWHQTHKKTLQESPEIEENSE